MRAHDTGDNVHTILQQAVPEAPGKLAVVATVDYAPGQASEGHRHLGSVFAVVSKGEVLSQVNGGPLHRYRAGEGWYEAPARATRCRATRARPSLLSSSYSG